VLFVDTAPILLYSLSIHDALPISWVSGGSSPTSSRNSVPPWASANLPTWSPVAPVNAPFLWPNGVDSTRSVGMAPQLTVTKGRRSEEHTSELQSRENLVCRLLLEK